MKLHIFVLVKNSSNVILALNVSLNLPNNNTRLGHELKHLFAFRWLYKLLSRIFFQAKVFVVNASRSPEEIKKRLGKIFSDLEAIEKVQGKVIKEFRKTFGEQVDSVVHQLSQHLLSDDIKKCFTKWSKEDAPDENARSWKKVEEDVNAALSKRFLEIADQWEEENKVFSTTRTSLMEQFQNHFDNVEFRLQNIQSEATDDNPNERKLTFRIKIKFWQKMWWNVKNIGLGVWYWYDSIKNLDLKKALKSVEKILYKDLLEDVSEDVLTKSLKKELKKFVEDKLKDAKLYLERTDARLQELIEADKELFGQLTKQPARYRPVFDEVKQHWNQLAKFGLTEVCAVKIDGKELEWKEEASSCLGRGAFGAVYQGKVRRDGEVTTVALKVWNEALDAANAKEIMEETKNLR